MTTLIAYSLRPSERHWVEDLGISQREMAERIGVSKCCVGNWEQNRVQVAGLLGVHKRTVIRWETGRTYPKNALLAAIEDLVPELRRVVDSRKPGGRRTTREPESGGGAPRSPVD